MNSQEVARILDMLAERFGTTVNHLWELLVRQARVYATSYAVLYILLFVVVYFYIRYLKANWSSIHKIMDNVDSGMVNIFIVMILLFSCIFAIVYLPEVITMFVNPEYWALKQVLGALP